jgi:hypothetical protein
MNSAGNEHALSTLRNLFGDNRSEWAPTRFRELFVQPSYFQKLQSTRPSILMGGRGTGKTTSLRSLRFDASFERIESQGQHFGDLEYLGIFVRINKNRVHAFCGTSIDSEQWRRTFAHYFHLLACSELVKLASWLEEKTSRYLTRTSLTKVSNDLAMGPVDTLTQLQHAIDDSISKLQLYVNNPEALARPLLSMAEVPLRTFTQVLNESGLSEERTIFCCIDEYENLRDEQQALLNTYVKHSEPPLSYKVGVRKNGLRTFATIDQSDELRAPDDYQSIEIENEGFEHFAQAVAHLRLGRAQKEGVPVPSTLQEFLTEMSFEEEARKLGADEVAQGVLAELKDDPKLYAAFVERPTSQTYFLKYWSESQSEPVTSLARDWMLDDQTWRNRLNNYGYASLFWLSRGRKGARIRKFYCGARVFLTLPAGNIRYFLELIDTAISHEFDVGNPFPESDSAALSPQSQTLAARDVGQRRLEQLEGLAEHGFHLKRLVLAIGKVLFELAREPLGRTPEVTHFLVNGAPEQGAIERLLSDGVAHLAFVVTPRTKATSSNQTRDNEYRLHPIFCAFFEISHRRKRSLTFSASDLELAIEHPSRGIALLLGKRQSPDDDLPEQLAFFSTFFTSPDA